MPHARAGRPAGAFAKIQLGALGTKLVVKMVDGRVVLLADITILRLDDFAEFGLSATSCGSIFGGGGRLGVVNTGFARSLRIPVLFNFDWSRLTFSFLRCFEVSFTRRRRARTSGQ